MSDHQPPKNVTFTVPLKSVGIAYVLWFFFGVIGVHKFYLGRPAMGIIYLFTLGILFLGFILDLFTLPSQVRAANRRIREDYQRA